MTRSKQREWAFTVVELLVVIAIIGTLVGLILPAVGMVRARMRQTQCANNLRNFGAAEMAYETSKGSMSASRGWSPNQNIARSANVNTSASATNANAVSWVFPLLPFIEQQALYDAADSITTANSSLPNYSTQRINIVWCASDISELSDANRSSYVVNGGRFNGTPSGNYPLDWQANGCLDDRLKGTSDTFQIFQGPQGMSMAELTRGDGASNTFLLLENADVLGWNRADNERDVAVVWAPSIPTNNLNQNLRKTGQTFDNSNARPSSYHTNGFNVAFADGTVKFIAESIDYGVYCQLMTSNSQKLKDPSTNNNTAVSLPALTASSY
jgi:prepilin-type processing-associated H-X9-DG protein